LLRTLLFLMMLKIMILTNEVDDAIKKSLNIVEDDSN